MRTQRAGHPVADVDVDDPQFAVGQRLQLRLEHVANVLAREHDVDVRRAAVTGLSRQLPRNESVRPLLQRAARSDPVGEVREQAARALAPQ